MRHHHAERGLTMITSRRTQLLSAAAALAFIVGAMIAGYRSIGLAPFLLTVAALEAHMTEEWLTGFGPAMSRLFDISWSEHSFLLVFAFIGPTLYSLTALGLYYRVPIAGFLAWFIFIGPGVAEFTHFIFPLLRPAIQPDVAAPLSTAVSNGQFVADMRNYWLRATGTYYFPGLYTAALPMIPGIYAIVRLAGRRTS